MKPRIHLIIIAMITLSFSCGKKESGPTGPENTAPVLSIIDNQTVTAGQTKDIALSATDLDSDLLSFSIPTNPGFLSITGLSQVEDTATATLVIAPEETITGTFNATVQVSDGEGGVDSKNFSIDVAESTPSIDVYFPIAKGAKWEYRVDFPQNCNVPYSPWFEYPEGMLGTSITHGMGSWNAGQIDFEMLINDIYETSSNSSTWDISLSELGLKFYFYRTDTDATQCRLRLTIENGNANLDLIAVLPIGDPNWVIARSLARVNSEDLNQTFDVSVPSGEYKNCVKSVVNIYGDGTYVPSGTYPIETYLAPNVGVVKAVGKDRNGTILYTLELSNFNN
jgi:hypothetical protein